MQAQSLDFVQLVAINSISGYQKYFSPKKGFSCAHRLLYGGESCSQYVKRIIAEEGLFAAIYKSRKRFENCQSANQVLRASSSQNDIANNSPDSNAEQSEKDEQEQSNSKDNSQQTNPLVNTINAVENVQDSIDCCGSIANSCSSQDSQTSGCDSCGGDSPGGDSCNSGCCCGG